SLAFPTELHECHKPQGDLAQPLKRCAKCQTTLYCSRECQKDDWKVHKRSAHHKLLLMMARGRHNPGFHAVNDLFGMSANDSLHNMSERDAMVHLIDCFRMRCEDEYVFAANTVGIYNQENPLREFNKFLTLAEKRDGLLPSWWNAEKRKECVRLATGGDSWANIRAAVEKSDVTEHYNNPMMPMMLRVLGEKIYGKGFITHWRIHGYGETIPKAPTIKSDLFAQRHTTRRLEVTPLVRLESRLCS
ncbi:uncharacterized protein PAC_13067, partial [Phialocephala subalpina]